MGKIIEVIKNNIWIGFTMISGGLIIPSIFATHYSNSPIPLLFILWMFILSVTMSTVRIFKDRDITLSDIDNYIEEESTKSKARCIFYNFTIVMMNIGIIIIVIYSIVFLKSF